MAGHGMLRASNGTRMLDDQDVCNDAIMDVVMLVCMIITMSIAFMGIVIEDVCNDGPIHRNKWVYDVMLGVKKWCW